MMSVNRRGALFHWMMFGVLAAMGLFLILSAKVDTNIEIKGKWQLDFLQKSFLAAEKELVKIDQAARFAGWEAVLGLDWRGKCGSVDGYSYWNKHDTWDCLPDFKQELEAKVKEKMKAKGYNYSEITLDKKELAGKGELMQISSSRPYRFYQFSSSFRVDLGIDLEGEIQQILAPAVDLVGRCRNNLSLGDCIQENKPAAWKYRDCQENYAAEKRTIFFCVESKEKVFDHQGNSKPIRHLFALDFTPGKPLAIERAESSYDPVNNFFEIVFEDMDADSYRIYFTDHLELEGKKGSAELLKGEVFPGYFWDVKSAGVVDDLSKCASGVQKEANTAYFCAGKVYFTLSDARLVQGKEFLVGIAAVKEGKEGEIKLIKAEG